MHQQTVLIVDDNPMTRKLVRITLKEYRILEAEDGAQALALVAQQPLDLIIQDLRLPDIDGRALMQQIRELPQGGALPILAFSGLFATIKEAEGALDGFTDFIAKPIDPASMRAIVATYLPLAAKSGAPDPSGAAPLEQPDAYTGRLIQQLAEQARLTTALERRLAQRKAELAVLSGLLDSITSTHEIEPVLDQALLQCLDAIGGSFGAIYLYDEQDQLRLRVQFGFGLRQQAELADFFGARPLLDEVVHGGTLRNLSLDKDLSPQEQILLARLGTSCLVLIPLVAPPDVRGVLMGTPGYGQIDEDWLAFLSVLGRQIGRMIYEARAVAALREREAQYRNLVETSPDAIVLADAEARILFCNSRAAQLFAEPEPAALQGREALEILVPEERPRLRAVMEQLSPTQRTQQHQFTAQRVDGSTFPVEISSSAMVDQDGPARSTLHIVRDISERIQVEASQRAHEEAVRANVAKSEFLSRMSHELRTPLNVILGFAQVLELDPLNAEQQDSVHQILKSGYHLLSLINEVLDMARIEEGHLTLSIEAVQVREVVKQAVDMVQPLLKANALTLDAEVALCTTSYVLADRQRLLQIMLNLLSNAIKYNRPGGQVLVTCAPVASGHMQVSVADTGYGIAEQDQARLFVPFERLGAAHSAVEGTGLGLAIAHNLAVAMGGRLSVESVVGQGSRFLVELPQAESPMTGLPEEEAGHPEAAPSVRRCTLLYVEDNLSNLQLVERLLQRRPHVQLLVAMQGRLGLELAREHQPDLILLDLHLPDLRGDQVLQQLRQDPATLGIPVVVLSADATQRQVDRLLAQGVHAYLTKPLEVKRFLTLIDTLLDAATS